MKSVTRNREISEIFASSKDEKTTPGTVRVSELITDVSEQELRDLFKEFGSIQRVRIPRPFDKKSKQRESNGTAYITFWDKKDAEKALDHNRLLWRNSRILVSMTK